MFFDTAGEEQRQAGIGIFQTAGSGRFDVGNHSYDCSWETERQNSERDSWFWSTSVLFLISENRLFCYGTHLHRLLQSVGFTIQMVSL